jgi:hypothetical protein
MGQSLLSTSMEYLVPIVSNLKDTALISQTSRTCYISNVSTKVKVISHNKKFLQGISLYFNAFHCYL